MERTFHQILDSFFKRFYKARIYLMILHQQKNEQLFKTLKLRALLRSIFLPFTISISVVQFFRTGVVGVSIDFQKKHLQQ